MTKKIISVFLIIVSIISINLFSYPICAEGIDPEQYKPEAIPKNADQLAGKANVVIGGLQIVGSILSVAVLAILGIKYMIGSAEERAEYKKTMVPYVVGAVMVFAITNLLKIILPIARNLF